MSINEVTIQVDKSLTNVDGSGRDSFTLPVPGKELHCSIQVTDTSCYKNLTPLPSISKLPETSRGLEIYMINYLWHISSSLTTLWPSKSLVAARVSLMLTCYVFWTRHLDWKFCFQQFPFTIWNVYNSVLHMYCQQLGSSYCIRQPKWLLQHFFSLKMSKHPFQADMSTIILTGGTSEGMNAESEVFEYSGLGRENVTFSISKCRGVYSSQKLSSL